MEPVLDSFGQGVTREWLHNRQIVIYTTSQTTKTAIDTWFEITLSTIKEWNPNQIYLAMHDVSFNDNVHTNYGEERARYLKEQLEHLYGYQAIILPNTLQARIARFFINYELIGRSQSKVKRKVFDTRYEGLEWLRQYLP